MRPAVVLYGILSGIVAKRTPLRVRFYLIRILFLASIAFSRRARSYDNTARIAHTSEAMNRMPLTTFTIVGSALIIAVVAGGGVGVGVGVGKGIGVGKVVGASVGAALIGVGGTAVGASAGAAVPARVGITKT